MNLDQPEAYGEVDVSDALGATLASSEQWEQARRVDVRAPAGTSAVLVVGMGGSGIAGDVLGALAADRLGFPVVVHKDADLPAFVGPGTLVCAVSYSGATEETLSAAERALSTGARVVAVTSGDQLAALVGGAGHPVVEVPGGWQPRHALGWLAGSLLAVCGLDESLAEAAAAQRRALTACGPDVPAGANPAKRLASAMSTCDLVVAWGTSRVAGVAALRLACQLHEHAKLPAYRSVLPEVAHNEVAGWQEPDEARGTTATRGLVLLRDPAGETRPARDRVAPARTLVRHRFAWVEEVATTPGPAAARLAGQLLVVDLASVYAAIARDVDPTPVRGIDALKDAAAAAGGGRRA